MTDQRVGHVVRSLAATCCLLWCLGPSVQAEEPPDLSGTWVLNYELSDEPRRQAPTEVGESRRRRGPAGGGFGGPGGGGFGTGSGWHNDDRGGGPSVEDVDALRRAIGDQLTAPRLMTITQDDREVLFAYGDGRYVRIVPDGKEHAGIAGHSQVTRKASWQGLALFAEVKFETDQKVFHHIELRLDGEQLVLVTTLEPRGSQDEVRLRRVYNLTTDLPTDVADDPLL